MLEDLVIKDFALIDSVSLEFARGFTVLSGETGAGKSILIGALSFLLGGKADAHLIRSGAHEATVSATFFIGEAPDEFKSGARQHVHAAETGGEEDVLSVHEWLDMHGIEADDGRILLRRTLRDSGKSSAWIGSTSVARADLASFSSFLIDIHGQHEHQSLMKVAQHRKFLDAHAGIVDEVNKFTMQFAALVEKRKLLEQLNSSSEERRRKIEMYTFAVQEIGDAKLKADEDELLADEEARLSSYEKLYADIEAVTASLSDGENAVVPLLKQIRRDSLHALDMDKTLEQLDERVESAFYELSDIADEFAAYKSKLVFDPKRLEEVQERLSLIYNLKKKYASSPSAPISEVLAYADEARQNLERLGAGGTDKTQLEREVAELEKLVYVAAKMISDKRKAAGERMSKEVEAVLATLGMKNTKFSVRVAEKPGTSAIQKCGPYGMDDIEFLISANPGSPLLPLAHIASGGELSRVMLALKTIFAASDSVPTLIFDEIDTGIGGEVAVSVGSHLRNLAKSRQIFCITHLASIAVYADNQIKIEKSVADGKTSSRCAHVVGDNRVREIARMLSGDESSESLEHARSMLLKFGGV
ncbi:MAG: DNA repair protein RecN [Treponema sp.]|nr:DNA repair protein RecN [Treponema sp.]